MPKIFDGALAFVMRNLHKVQAGRGVNAPGTPEIPEGFVVLFAGNVGVAQRFATILDAAEMLKGQPRIHWVILGDGRKLAWVKHQVEQRGMAGTFHVLGRFPSETMPYFFAQASALLVSLRKDPIFSLTVPGKVQSYMASGKPLIASLDGEGAALVADAGCGMASPADDASALAEVVLKMSELPDAELQEMGARGQAFCRQHFDRTQLLDTLEELLQRCADRGEK